MDEARPRAPLFAMTLYYNTSANKAYNGNIMYQYWGTPGSLTNHYSYLYDRLNRLLSGSANTGNNESVAYDMMGNITILNRKQTTALTLIDGLSYSYGGTNQLQSVNDGSGNNTGMQSGITAYTYDGNGNMLSAANTVNSANNKSFTYNLLNLPLVATIPSGTATYTYDASGNKLRKVDYTTVNGNYTYTDYIAGIQYAGSTANPEAINRIQTEEGYAVPLSTGAFDYYYELGDNLGNTRITFDTQSGAATTRQQDDYYPFGLEINTIAANPKNEYLYNKKELQEELQEYDYGARFYDPIIGRWTSVDPLAEKSRRWSPYNYVEDNPIRMIDPDGMDATTVHINGDEADKAFKALKKSTSLTLTRDTKTGELSATGTAKTNADKKLLAAITDTKVDVRLNATSSNEVKMSDGSTGNLIIGAYGGSHVGSDGKSPVGEQSINMDQAEKVQQNGGNTASQSVFHEVIESYSALKMGDGIHTPGTANYDSTYGRAHSAAKALDPSYSDGNVHKDEGHLKAGFNTYFHTNPTTGNEVILFDVKQ